MKRTLVIFIGVLLLTSLAFGGVTKVGTTAAGFLSIDVGAQAVSMGGAYVAVANDATSMYWNVAGIARIQNYQAVFNHSKWIADVNINYLGMVIPLYNVGTFGVNVTSMTMDEMERTTIDKPEGTGDTFAAGSYALGLAFARNLTDRFSIGFNVKYITENIYNSSASGVAFDIGTLFTTQFNGLKIGMSITNYGTKLRMNGRDMLTQVDIDPRIAGNNENMNADLQTDAYDLPLLFRVGVAMDVLKGMANSNLIIAVDALHPNNDTERLNVGAEYVFNQMFFLRGGYNSLGAEDAEGGLSFGGGMKYSMGSSALMVDYAYKDFGILNTVQMVTLGLSF